jgi:hypothetical protein
VKKTHVDDAEHGNPLVVAFDLLLVHENPIVARAATDALATVLGGHDVLEESIAAFTQKGRT